MQVGKPKRRRGIQTLLEGMRLSSSVVKKYNPKAVLKAADHYARQRIEQVDKQSRSTGRSEYLGNVVYGALDGIITTFAIASGVVGADLSSAIILILGLANLLGDGFSMAAGAYLSAKSEQEVYEREREHAAERVANKPQMEREALLDLYKEQNFPTEDALQMVQIVSKDPGRWVGTMMIERLLMLPQKRKPLIEGLATFFAFLVAGSIPLLVYAAEMIFEPGISNEKAFLISVVLSGMALFGLGAAKVYITGRNALRSGLEMLIVGGLAAGVAFGIGTLLKSLGGPGG